MYCVVTKNFGRDYKKWSYNLSYDQEVPNIRYSFMKEYIVARQTDEEYDHMIRIYDWCNENFIDTSSWHVSWADNTEDRVKFTFYKEEEAIFFALKWI